MQIFLFLFLITGLFTQSLTFENFILERALLEIKAGDDLKALVTNQKFKQKLKQCSYTLKEIKNELNMQNLADHLCYLNSLIMPINQITKDFFQKEMQKRILLYDLKQAENLKYSKVQAITVLENCLNKTKANCQNLDKLFNTIYLELFRNYQSLFKELEAKNLANLTRQKQLKLLFCYPFFILLIIFFTRKQSLG